MTLPIAEGPSQPNQNEGRGAELRRESCARTLQFDLATMAARSSSKVPNDSSKLAFGGISPVPVLGGLHHRYVRI